MIVIPMAGLSSRFAKAGYTEPKYMLAAHDGKPLFDFAVYSFMHYFESEEFIFIVRDIHSTDEFVRQRCESLGIRTYQIITLDQVTNGQASTVYLGLKQISNLDHDAELAIFNIDTMRERFHFQEPDISGDGYLEVFRGSGDNWSYVEPITNSGNRVLRTAEKLQISDLCSNGLYHFKKLEYFLSAYEGAVFKGNSVANNGELYIAPLYNWLISNGLDIRYHLVSRDLVTFFGTPDEYDHFLKTNIPTIE